MLHVTNGEAAAGPLRRAGLPGRVIAWNDVLHEGPVPAGEGEAALRATRARFLAGQGWGEHDAILAELERRDAALAAAGAEDEVVLWFEHDLYDQLQLLQLLDRLAAGPGAEGRVRLVCIGRHPAVERFLGLGQLRAEHFAELFPAREAVDAARLDLARRAWAAFRDPDPTAVERVLGADVDALPFLRAALVRHLEQFPAVAGGLSRTGRQVVEVLASGVRRPGRIFRATQDLEEAPFLGDTSLWSHLTELAGGPRPLLRARDGAPLPRSPRPGDWDRELELTADGERVRELSADWVRLRGGVDRWHGGVHLAGPEPRWRWDADRGRLAGA